MIKRIEIFVIVSLDVRVEFGELDVIIKLRLINDRFLARVRNKDVPLASERRAGV